MKAAVVARAVRELIQKGRQGGCRVALNLCADLMPHARFGHWLSNGLRGHSCLSALVMHAANAARRTLARQALHVVLRPMVAGDERIRQRQERQRSAHFLSPEGTRSDTPQRGSRKAR